MWSARSAHGDRRRRGEGHPVPARARLASAKKKEGRVAAEGVVGSTSTGRKVGGARRGQLRDRLRRAHRIVFQMLVKDIASRRGADAALRRARGGLLGRARQGARESRARRPRTIQKTEQARSGDRQIVEAASTSSTRRRCSSISVRQRPGQDHRRLLNDKIAATGERTPSAASPATRWARASPSATRTSAARSPRSRAEISKTVNRES